MQRDAADEQKIEEQSKSAKVRAELSRERWRQVMALPQAQDLMFDLLDELFVFRLSFDNSGSRMAFNEGQRSVGLNLLDRWQDASPETFVKTWIAKKGVKNV